MHFPLLHSSSVSHEHFQQTPLMVFDNSIYSIYLCIYYSTKYYTKTNEIIHVFKRNVYVFFSKNLMRKKRNCKARLFATTVSIEKSYIHIKLLHEVRK